MPGGTQHLVLPNPRMQLSPLVKRVLHRQLSCAPSLIDPRRYACE